MRISKFGTVDGDDQLKEEGRRDKEGKEEGKASNPLLPCERAFV